jgi:hypothetical protein
MRIVFVIALVGLMTACSGSSSTNDSGAQDVVDVAPETSTDPGEIPVDVLGDSSPDIDGDNPADVVDPWADATSYQPGIETRGNIKILRLKGTAYEMGRQHGQFLHDELVLGGQFLDTDPLLSLLEPLAADNGYIEEAVAQSYPDILDECRGMAEIVGEEGWTFNRCMALAWGDVVLENIGMPTACSQFIATGKATKDAAGGGELIHGRNLDWDKIDFLLENPVVIVRHPTGRIPYVVIGFPGNVATYNGINAAGISCGSNQNHAAPSENQRAGRSEIQMMNEVLASATSLEDIRALFQKEERSVGNNLVFADGDHDTGAVFELTAFHMGERAIDDQGVVFATNHYVVPDMIQYGIEVPEDKSTKTRFMRLQELLLPDGKDTLYGKLDLENAVKVLRDRWNPYTQVMAPLDVFDGQGTIANNGCVYSIVFAPKRRAFWLATGSLPIPMNPYQGFTLDELFGKTGAAAPDPVQIP